MRIRNKMKLATVFSGIGAPEYATRRLFGELDVVFACDCGECRIPKGKKEKDPLSEKEIAYLETIKDPVQRQTAVKKAYLKVRNKHWIKEVYMENYHIPEEKWHDDIRFIDGSLYRGKVDLLVGGSPCQSFSQMGHRKGLEDVRGTLFYYFAKLIRDVQPKAFIFENVPGMITHDGGRTWAKVLEVFDRLDYQIVLKDVLNAVDYGMPQNRKRLFVIGIKDKKAAKRFVPPKPIKLERFAPSFLEPRVDARYYLKKLGFIFTTTNTARARINQNIIRTQKKNQQFNWNGDFVFEARESLMDREDILASAYFGQYDGKIGAVRKMTPVECHRLMGFDERDFFICPKDTEAYKQSGNSIVVPVMEALIRAIHDTGALK